MFDALQIVKALSAALERVARFEIHSVAYLARISSLADSSADQDFEWEYAFSTTPFGAPYAPELSDALDRLVALGALAIDDLDLQISERGDEALSAWGTASRSGDRLKYLNAATSAASIIPLPSVVAALSSNPRIAASFSRKTAVELFDDGEVARYRNQLSRVHGQLDREQSSSPSLLSIVSVWLASAGSIDSLQISRPTAA